MVEVFIEGDENGCKMPVKRPFNDFGTQANAVSEMAEDMPT